MLPKISFLSNWQKLKYNICNMMYNNYYFNNWYIYILIQICRILLLICIIICFFTIYNKNNQFVYKYYSLVLLSIDSKFLYIQCMYVCARTHIDLWEFFIEKKLCHMISKTMNIYNASERKKINSSFCNVWRN